MEEFFCMNLVMQFLVLEIVMCLNYDVDYLRNLVKSVIVE